MTRSLGEIELDQPAPSKAVSELPASEEVCTNVLEYLDALRHDAGHRALFYDGMGVVHTELQEGVGSDAGRILYKDEREQPSVSFKTRGASNAVILSPDANCYVAESTGNHGRSVGIAAKKAGKPAIIFGVDTMSKAKKAGVLATGAELRLAATFDEAAQFSKEASQISGAVRIAPFGSLEVLAGQCTLGDELVEDIVKRSLGDTVVIIPVSIAGGGLITGIAVPIWEAKQAGRIGPNVHVVGVQPEGTDTMNRALHKLRLGQIACDLYPDTPLDTDCDALAIGETSLNADTMAIVDDPAFVTGVHTVSKLAIARAMDELEARLGGLVEPAAALGQAFVRQHASMFFDLRNITFIPVISGGNKSPETAAIYRRIERNATWQDFVRWSRQQTTGNAEQPIKIGGTDQYTGRRKVGANCLNGPTIRGYTPSPYSGR